MREVMLVQGLKKTPAVHLGSDIQNMFCTNTELGAWGSFLEFKRTFKLYRCTITVVISLNSFQEFYSEV